MAISPAEEAFQEATIRALGRLRPGARVGVMPGLRLRVALPDGRSASVGLLGAFKSFLAAGGRAEAAEQAAEAHVRHVLDALGPAPAKARAPGGSAPAAGQETYDEARAHVLPLLEADTFFEATGEAAPDAPRLLRFPVVQGELALALVLPGAGRSMRFLSEADAERWKKDPVLLEHEARQNLEARVRGRLTLSLRHNAVALVEDTTWFRGTLALVPSFRQRLTDLLGERPLLALPARDHLVALSREARAACEPLLEECARRYDSDPQPLSEGLYEVEPAGLRLAGRLPA